jgi:hypothetical protein
MYSVKPCVLLFVLVCTGTSKTYWYIQDQGVTVHTSMYLYVPVHTRKSNMLTVHNLGNRTGNLLHSNQLVVPLEYQRAIVGVNIGLFEVYRH